MEWLFGRTIGLRLRRLLGAAMSHGSYGPRLRAARLNAGLTQQELAEALASTAWLVNRQHIGVNADMVSKWERGAKQPSAMYRRLLAATDAVQIEEPLRAERDMMQLSVVMTAVNWTALSEDPDDLVEAHDLGPAGFILRQDASRQRRDQLVERRSLLKLLGLAPLASALDGLIAEAVSDQETVQVDEVSVAALDTLLDRYRVLYKSTPPLGMLRTVRVHLQTATRILDGTRDPELRRRTLRNRGEVAVLAGRLSFFDLRDPTNARAYLNLGLESAREAGDQALSASAFGHLAFVPAAEGLSSASLQHLDAARQHAVASDCRLLLAWLDAVEAEIDTNAGHHSSAMRAIDRARAVMSDSAAQTRPTWLDFFDAGRLDGFAGYTLLKARRGAESRSALTRALQSLPADAVKQQAVYLTDLATLDLEHGDVDAACAGAVSAVAALASAGYATGSDRIREFRRSLRPWNTVPAVRQLDERLMSG